MFEFFEDYDVRRCGVIAREEGKAEGKAALLKTAQKLKKMGLSSPYYLN